MAFDKVDWLGVLAWAFFIFWQPKSLYNRNGKVLFPKWYNKNKKRIIGILSNWLFALIWFVLNLLIIASISLVWANQESEDLYNPIIILHLFNVLFNKLWTFLFFSNKKSFFRITVAFIDIIFALGTGIAILVLSGKIKAWVSFGLYFPYVIWLLYVTFLNFQWLLI